MPTLTTLGISISADPQKGGGYVALVTVSQNLRGLTADELCYHTNRQGEGLFITEDAGATSRQIKGTAQFHATSLASFKALLRRYFLNRAC